MKAQGIEYAAIRSNLSQRVQDCAVLGQGEHVTLMALASYVGVSHVTLRKWMREDGIDLPGTRKKRKRITEATRTKISKSLMGKVRRCSEETKAKIAKALRGYKATQSTRSKLSAMRKGRPISEETKLKLSIANKGREYKGRRVPLELQRAKKAAGNKAYRLSNRAKDAARLRAWRKANPDKVTDAAHRRRALKLGAFVENVSKAEVYARDGGRCHICGKKVDPKRWHLDHITALKRKGKHSYRNVAVSCPTCNLSKGSKAIGQLRLF